MDPNKPSSSSNSINFNIMEKPAGLSNKQMKRYNQGLREKGLLPPLPVTYLPQKTKAVKKTDRRESQRVKERQAKMIKRLKKQAKQEKERIEGSERRDKKRREREEKEKEKDSGSELELTFEDMRGYEITRLQYYIQVKDWTSAKEFASKRCSFPQSLMFYVNNAFEKVEDGLLHLGMALLSVRKPEASKINLVIEEMLRLPNFRHFVWHCKEFFADAFAKGFGNEVHKRIVKDNIKNVLPLLNVLGYSFNKPMEL